MGPMHTFRGKPVEQAYSEAAHAAAREKQLELPGISYAIPMILTCPSCSIRHIDTGEYATKLHHTHACQACGMVWRPAVLATVGVRFLPGFKTEQEPNDNHQIGDI